MGSDTAESLGIIQPAMLCPGKRMMGKTSSLIESQSAEERRDEQVFFYCVLYIKLSG